MEGSPLMGPTESPVLHEALRRRQKYVESKTAGQQLLVWGSICLAALLDANYSFIARLLLSQQAGHTVVFFIYLVDSAIFVLSLTILLFLFWRWVSPLYSSPLQLSDEQYRLLRLEPNTPGFCRSPRKEETRYPNPFSPLSGSLLASPKQSPASPAQSSTPVNTSLHSWMSSSGLSSGSGSPSAAFSPASNTSLNTSANLRRDHYTGCESPITDANQLYEYLNDYSAWESSYMSDKFDDSGSVASQSLLRRTAGPRMESPVYRKTMYQLSTPPSKTANSTSDSQADKAQTEILSQRLGVDPMRLVTWNENLRIWLTQTILRPLVSEIETLNSSLPKNGVSDCKIGESPLDRLRKVGNLPQIASNLPTFSSILPFLEVAQDQEYLVARLKELAGTGALSLYRWNSGGSCRGQTWTDKLPTDSEIILHVLASYLDSRLVASSRTRMADTRESMPFTRSHFFKFGEKVEAAKLKDFLAIVQVKARPPHYVLQVGDKQLDVGAGRNNLIHTILLLLHQVREERGGMIGRVNLGLSGLNILWVLD